MLKGALLLKTIGIPRARPTMDIDMLRKGKADQASLIALVKDCATLDVEADGLTFLADSAVDEEITKDWVCDSGRKSISTSRGSSETTKCRACGPVVTAE